MTQYRKKLADQESQIQILNEKNNDLKVRLDRYARAKKKNGIVISDSGLNGDNDTEYSGPESSRPQGHMNNLNDELEAKSMDLNTRRRGGKSSGKSFSPRAKDESSSTQEVVTMDEESVKEQLKTFLVNRLKDLIDLKACQEEINHLESKGVAISDEKCELGREFSAIQKQRTQAEESLRRRIGDLDSKIESLRQQYAKLSKSSDVSHPDSQQRLKDIKFSIDSYEEHRHEFFDRLQQGLLPSDTAARAQDLQEDLEVLQTELELNDARIIQEKGQLSKLLKKDAGAHSDALLSRLNAMKSVGKKDSSDGKQTSALEEAIGGLFFDDVKRFQQQILPPPSRPPVSTSPVLVVSDCTLRQLIQMLLDSTFSSRSSDGVIKMLSQKLDDKQVIGTFVILSYYAYNLTSLYGTGRARRAAAHDAEGEGRLPAQARNAAARVRGEDNFPLAPTARD